MKKRSALIIIFAIFSLSLNICLSSAYDSLIYNAQIKLNEVGYNCGTPDGIWGENTAKSIKKFQKNNDLQITGELDNDTIEKLNIGNYASHHNTNSNPSLMKGGGTVVKSVGDTLQQYGDNHSSSFLGKSTKLAGRIYSSVGGNIVEVSEGKNVGKASKDFHKEAFGATKSFCKGSSDNQGSHITTSTKNSKISKENSVIVNKFLSENSVEKVNASKIIYRDYLQNANVVNIVNDELLKNYHLNSKDKYFVDALAWMCKILGASGNKDYASTLVQVLQKSPSRKVRKYANNSLKTLTNK